jgi:hypothetical protein
MRRPAIRDLSRPVDYSKFLLLHIGRSLERRFVRGTVLWQLAHRSRLRLSGRRRIERTSPSHYLVTRGATGPDAIDQAYGLAANLMTQQAAMLAFMDYFHLLSLVVLAGLPLAFFIRRF